MGTENTNDSALKEIAVDIENAKAELQLINEDLATKKAEHEKALALVGEEYKNLEEIRSAIITDKGELAEIEEKKGEASKAKPFESKAFDLPTKEVNVKFIIPVFNFKGVDRKSSELEAAAAEGDEEALAIIEELIEIKASVIEVTEKGEQ